MSKLTDTPHGFIWGPMIVERTCHDDGKIGYILTVRGERCPDTVEIRVTPKGTQISVEKHNG